MKFKLTPIRPGKCKIQLLPVTDDEKKITDHDTFQAYFQIALSSKLGPKAKLMSVDEMEMGFTMTANYIIEGGSLGNQ